MARAHHGDAALDGIGVLQARASRIEDRHILANGVGMPTLIEQVRYRDRERAGRASARQASVPALRNRP